jgi:phosphoribosylaminoimidazole-succinocarboxamide synthase
MSSSLALDHLASGKVRELYDAGEGRLLLVASDRISAFDVVLPTPIPDKGRVLTALSLHWFALTADIVRNHVISARLGEFPEGARDPGLAGRALLVRRLEMLPLECVVRGYLAGSGWKDYGRTGAVCGIPLPDGLREADRLPRTLFTPSTKATSGHDENITAEQGMELVGERRYREVERASIALYERAAASALERGIILADTKFEFGIDSDGSLVVGDEVLTPDSSRFWPADSYAPGASPPSFDKQYVRDWLETQPWDKTPPGPELPDEVRDGTAARYREAYERLAGRPFASYLDEMGASGA